MKLSDGERLILVMLANIQKALKVDDGIDSDTVLSSIYSGNLWGLQMEYAYLFGEDKSEEVVRNTFDILDMWKFIEDDWKRLSEEDQKLVSERTGRTPQFIGFDGNAEIDHLSAARYLVEDLGKFEGFRGRDFNSHSPSLERYLAMYRVFEPIRATLTEHKRLTAEQLIAILNADRPPTPKERIVH